MNTSAKNSIFSSSELGKLVVEASPAGMIIADNQGQIVLVNPQALQWFGYEEAELLGQKVEVLLPGEHRQTHRATRAQYEQAPRRRPMGAGRNLFAQRKDGSEFPVDISLHPIQTDAGAMVLANIVDATQRHQAEKDRELAQSMEKLALLGQLAGGVAHEIRTPLCVIGNDVYFLQTLADQLNPEANECVQEIKTAVSKANQIVSELLDFTRDPESTLEPALLGEIVDTAVAMSAISPAALEIPAGDWQAWQVMVDRDQIERILINLLRNANQAMQSNGQTTVEIAQEASMVAIRVCDTGPGISPEHRDRVFEPLFTTKPKGIGLGLAVSRRYAQRNGGQLTLLRSTSTGSIFQLCLPYRGA